MSPRTPVLPLVLALALWAVGLASSSRGLERCAAGPAAARAQANPVDEIPRPAALETEALAAGVAVTPAGARWGAPEAAEGPCPGVRAGSLARAVAAPLVRLSFLIPWGEPWSPWEDESNAVITALVLGGFAHLSHVNGTQTLALEQEVKVLEGLLPICSFCKKIRDAGGAWQPLERYIGERSGAEFSHGVPGLRAGSLWPVRG